MAEAKLGFLQMQLELVITDAMKLRQPVLGIAAERLNVVDMVRTFDELIVAVIVPKVFFQIDTF